MPIAYRILGIVICLVFFGITARKTWISHKTGQADITNHSTDKEPRILKRSEDPVGFDRHQKLNYLLLIALLGGVAMAIFR